MRFKCIFILSIIILFAAGDVRSIPAVESIEELRPKGSERTYLINYK